MQILGLTGSIANGKSYVATRFWRMGIPVFDSDAAVHALYEPKSPILPSITKLFGDVLDNEGSVDRQKLGASVLSSPEKLKALEKIVHPAVLQSQLKFLKRASMQRINRVVLDIPLLFETKAEKRFDATLVVYTSSLLQEQRALTRPGMNKTRLEAVRSKQLHTAIKLKRCDYAINSSCDRGQLAATLNRILTDLESRQERAWPEAWRG